MNSSLYGNVDTFIRPLLGRKNFHVASFLHCLPPALSLSAQDNKSTARSPTWLKRQCKCQRLNNAIALSYTPDTWWFINACIYFLNYCWKENINLNHFQKEFQDTLWEYNFLNLGKPKLYHVRKDIIEVLYSVILEYKRGNLFC